MQHQCNLAEFNGIVASAPWAGPRSVRHDVAENERLVPALTDPA